MTKNRTAIFIFPFAFLSLLFGILAGFQRINWNIPLTNLAGDHGALMTGSFIGTLICLERSIIHPQKWWRILPLINGLSILLFIFNLTQLAYCLLIVGSTGLLILMISYFVNARSIPNALLSFGAFSWLTGNLILFNQHSYPAAVKWWLLFLLWTIFGERLELSRMLPVSSIKRITLYLILSINIISVFLPFHLYGNKIFAISLLALAGWLFVYDMSRYAIRHAGQHRYIACWILFGYGWLVVTSAWLLCWPDAAFAYDAALHCFFLGFVFSMIFGHAPIIFPGIFRINISLYHPILYVIFFLFNTSLLTRILGDALLNSELRKWGALCNGISILLFFITTLILVITRLKNKRHVTTGRKYMAGN